MISNQIVGVLGANSFIGRHVVRGLARQRVKVRALGRKFPVDFEPYAGANVETRLIDFNNELETIAAIQGCSHIIQLINTSNPAIGNKRVLADLQYNVAPHVSFIQSAIDTGVEHFIFISSGGSVYGNSPMTPIAETQPARPLNSYAMSKRIVEQYLEMLCTGAEMGYTIVRLANPFGPDQFNTKGQGLIPTILQRHKHKLPVDVLGDGRSERDYIYIDDVVEAIGAILDRSPTRQIVNVGSGRGRSIMDVIGTIETLLGEKIERSFLPSRLTDPKSNVLNIEKAKLLFGWDPKVEFEEGVRRTLRAHNLV